MKGLTALLFLVSLTVPTFAGFKTDIDPEIVRSVISDYDASTDVLKSILSKRIPQFGALVDAIREPYPFRKGDIVHRKDNRIIRDVVKSVPGDAEYDRVGYGAPDDGFVLESNSWEYQEHWEKE